MVGIIYKVTNDVNDKVYIGQTVYLLENRWEWHLRGAENPNDNSKFHKAIRDIGKEHFRIEEIDRVSKDILDDAEVNYICKYNSFFNGYNSTLGGGGKRSYVYTDKSIVDDIITLYCKGISSNKIAVKYKVDKATILRVLRLYGIEIKDRTFNPNDNEKIDIITKYREGYSLSKLSRKYKVAGSTIKRFLELNGVNISYKNYILRDDAKCKEIADDYKNHNVNMQYTMHKYGICFSTLKQILKRFNVPVKNTNGKLKQYNYSTSVQALTSNVEG